MSVVSCNYIFFFFNDTATTEIYTLSLHDALPILLASYLLGALGWLPHDPQAMNVGLINAAPFTPGHLLGTDFLGRERDRKSTRLNSSHSQISYAVFCLKKKKNT